MGNMTLGSIEKIISQQGVEISTHTFYDTSISVPASISYRPYIGSLNLLGLK